MSAHPHADRIFVVDTIETMLPGAAPATSVAVADGRVIAVGDRVAMEPLIDDRTDIVHYPGATLLPGLVDGHIHPVWGTIELTRGVNLTDISPVSAVIERLREAADGMAPDEWLLGWGLDPNVLEAPMSGHILKDALDNRPVALRLRDGHSLVISPRAVELAGLTGRETFADRSSVEVDDDGVPSGLILELAAMELVFAVIPPEPREVQAKNVLAVLHQMSSVGLTGGHVMDCAPGTEEILRLIEESTELPIRLRISPMCPPDSGEDVWESIARAQGTGGRRWHVEGVKFMLDGTVDNGTAWLSEPDHYGESTDSIWNDTSLYRAAIRFFAERGIPTATHAIGDFAVRFALEVIEGLGELRARTTHRIEHIESIPDELVDRFAALGVTASMQPVHGTHHTRADRTDNWSIRLGPERASHGWRCRDLRDAGATLVLGSDWPITPADPRAMMADTQLRRPVERPEVAPVQPEQALTAREAHEGYTVHTARAIGDSERGAVAVGNRADFTIFDRNPLALSADEQALNPIRATVIDGTLQYQSRG